MIKSMNLLPFSITIMILISSLSIAQELEIEGTAKVSVMDPATASAQPVGRESDGTLVLMQPATATYSVGDFAHGGVVFWVTPSGDHGRVASLYNITEILWSNISSVEIGGSAQSDKNGAGNSVAIVTQSGHTASASQQCLELAFAGYDDWYLPAKNELNQMYINKAVIDSTSAANGGEAMESVGYWSSTEQETDASEAWNQSFFGAGTQQSDSKSAPFHARAIRAF